MTRAPVVFLLIAAAGCGQPAKSNVVARDSDKAAWTATGRVVYLEVVGQAPTRTAIKMLEPGSGDRTTVGEVIGDVTFLDADDTDRILLGGIGGAYTILRQNGDVLYTVVNVPDATDGYVALHLSASGTMLALVTHPPMPDLQVHQVTDAATLQNFVDFEGTAQVREIDWSPDDQQIYYIARDPTGVAADRIVRVPATDAAQKTLVYQDPSVPRFEKVFVSNDGATLLVSGEDAAGVSGVWTIPSAGGAATLVGQEGGNRLRVAAATGPSPDGTRFVLHSTTARGTLLTVERLE